MVTQKSHTTQVFRELKAIDASTEPTQKVLGEGVKWDETKIKCRATPKELADVADDLDEDVLQNLVTTVQCLVQRSRLAFRVPDQHLATYNFVTPLKALDSTTAADILEGLEMPLDIQGTDSVHCLHCKELVVAVAFPCYIIRILFFHCQSIFKRLSYSCLPQRLVNYDVCLD